MNEQWAGTESIMQESLSNKLPQTEAWNSMIKPDAHNFLGYVCDDRLGWVARGM